ncbi:MAG TPA: bifunctional DNA-formamidopyrimidine glycosylase/DNA-(apurinic or apyrimidinic site) lyase [Candidatus Paceibacterota bacterium]
MPELPEVQTTVNGLNARITGLTIRDVWTDYNSSFHKGKDSIKDPAYFSHFKSAVEGARIVRVDRIAKNILVRIEKDGHRSVILIHMKMTGHIMFGRYEFDSAAVRDPWKPAADASAALHDPFNRFIHLVFSFEKSDKQLILSDMRKFAKVTLITEAEIAESTHLADIGPDPLTKEFTYDVFKTRIMRRPTGRIKNVLMDQSVIAGVGNIYSDEALWRAGIHPEEQPKNIPEPLMKKLYPALIAVLKSGIDFGGDSMSDYRNIDGERGEFQEHHKVYRKKGLPCAKPGCTGTIIRKVVGGRSAHFCDTHQKLLIKKSVQKNTRSH